MSRNGRRSREYIDEKLEQCLIEHESDRADVSQKMQNQVSKIDRDFEQTNLAQMKKTDVEEKTLIFDYLLK